MSCGAGSVRPGFLRDDYTTRAHLHLFERLHALQQVDLGRVSEALVERGVVDLRVECFRGQLFRVGSEIGDNARR